MTKSVLFEPYKLGPLELKNRFVMAPMTRSRSTEPGDVPNELMAKYYEQRSSAGLIISEATQISLQGKGYARTPGIYTKDQVEGWKKVTKAVHSGGGKIVLQLWHVGRVGSSVVNGLQPIGPSAIVAKDTSVYVFDGSPNGDATFVPVEAPREATLEDIANIVKDFANGAKNAIEAGFDAVEVHAANGYIIDQFLRSNSNKRCDSYGGSKENRVRFLLEIARAVSDVVGKERVGVRLSPFIKFKDMDDPEILDTILIAASGLQAIGVSFLHLCEADWSDAPVVPDGFRKDLRGIFSGAIIATGNKDPEGGASLINSGMVDLVGFGRKFISNPDYPKRVLLGAPINQILDTHTLFGGGGARGYTDYPAAKNS